MWLALVVAAAGATIGWPVVIGGQAADIALDEPRGVLYIANFTAGRVDVLSLDDLTIRTSMHVAPGPSSLALSRDGRYLVVTHYGNSQAPASPANGITLINLSSGARQTFSLGSPPLGVAFGVDGMALVATTTEFLRLDPASGRTEWIDSIEQEDEEDGAGSLPAAPGTPPVEIVAAAVGSSGDGRWIFGITDSIRFSYEVATKQLRRIHYTATPAHGPRVVSAARDGSYYAAGWGVFDRQGFLTAQFGNAAGLLAVGSHAIDSDAGILYAQIPQANGDPAAPPVLSVVDADNLTVRERFRLTENLAGRALLNSQADTLYSVSESGVLVIPVGNFARVPRITADQEDLVFHGNFCQRGAITRVLRLVDPSGGATSFVLNTDLAGVTISPTSGRTPATIQVKIAPAAFQDRRGTIIGQLTISSSQAVNLPGAVRILVNNRRPDERGSFTPIRGILADLVADPARDRFYVLRQDRNQVLVFDGSSLTLVSTLRTGTTPTRTAITVDRKHLLVGHENSQLLYVYDLDTLLPLPPIQMPRGHYPRSVAASANAILVASRVAGEEGHSIDRVDLVARTAVRLPALGVFQNAVHVDTILAATPNGSSVLVALADGTVMLYDAADDTFIASRKLGSALTGAVAASGFGQFLVGSTLLNGSLVPVGSWPGTEFPSGFAFVGGQGIRLTGPSTATGAGGTIERVDLTTGERIRPTRVGEQPLISSGLSAFTRNLAPLSNRSALIALTVSGITALPWDFDAATVPPTIQRVVNAADLTANVAPGSLISVFGTNLSPVNAATREIPLPTAIGESCLTANGAVIPMMFASPGQINAQLPVYLDGRVTMTLHTPGGVSDDYYLNLLPAAPAVFHSGTAGPMTSIPVVIKNSNQQLVTPSNPIRAGDEISVYATGLGPTSPEVEAGMPAPSSPLATTILVPEVRLGGVPLAVSFAGLAPGNVGVFQINARAPSNLPLGAEVPLTISQGGVTASVNLRVVE
jgi:uncharacterized protein (TIGR03437 family)